MPKNIVVFSDGTGQEGGKGHPTNIYKTFRMLENRTPGQITFYDRGLGSGWRKFSGKAFGMGISKNIKQCYSFIFDHYEAGDQIFLFGFSRGAATVRSLSGFIHMFGLLPKSRPELIDLAWKTYRIGNKDKREKKAAEFVRTHPNMWVRVHFLGVYDTVAALGVPYKFMSKVLDRMPFFHHKFHDLDLSECVENAYQALAIDDERKTFHPMVWNPKKLERQHVDQVWFAGAHTDVGGGYEEHQLSDIPLNWMMSKARGSGIHIYPSHDVETTPSELGEIHDPFEGLVPWRREQRTWDSTRHDTPRVHVSVVNRNQGTDYQPWILKLKHEVVKD
jgi:uncharacterized protein (DUF2235 family)